MEMFINLLAFSSGFCYIYANIRMANDFDYDARDFKSIDEINYDKKFILAAYV